jgi:uncharacterized membrane protein
LGAFFVCGESRRSLLSKTGRCVWNAAPRFLFGLLCNFLNSFVQYLSLVNLQDNQVKEETMSELVVLVFKGDEDRASAAYKELEPLAKHGQIAVDGGAVAVKDKGGKVKLRQTSDWSKKKGIFRGGFWGLLIGIIFAVPVVGVLLGVVLGLALKGKQILDPEFTKELADEMEAGDSALFVVVSPSGPKTYEHTLQTLKDTGGNFFQTELTEDAQAALEKALENKEVAEAAESVVEENGS